MSQLTEMSEYKKEIPQLKQIKKSLKNKCYETKQHLNNVMSGMLGSDGLAIRESLIEDINSLKEKVKKLESRLAELTEQ